MLDQPCISDKHVGAFAISQLTDFSLVDKFTFVVFWGLELARPTRGICQLGIVNWNHSRCQLGDRQATLVRQAMIVVQPMLVRQVSFFTLAMIAG